MMISPETFYEENLKGKSAEEILRVIRGLKREIGRLKNIMEHPGYAPFMCPSEDVQISCTRDYLERAKQALAEVGGTYTPSQAELRAEKFNANLPSVWRVEFEINSYSTGYEERTYVIEDDKVITKAYRNFYTSPSEPFDEVEIDKDTLINGLADLHIGEWRREYDPKRFDIRVLDGFTWYLNLYFSNGARPVKIDGCNDFPYNFAELLELFDVELFTIDDLRGTSDEAISPSNKLTKFESFENAKKRIDAKKREKQIKKKLKNPNLSDEEREELMDLLWEGIDVKESASANDYSTEEIDKLFETVPRGLIFTGTGYNPRKIPPKKRKVKG